MKKKEPEVIGEKEKGTLSLPQTQSRHESCPGKQTAGATNSDIDDQLSKEPSEKVASHENSALHNAPPHFSAATQDLSQRYVAFLNSLSQHWSSASAAKRLLDAPLIRYLEPRFGRCSTPLKVRILTSLLYISTEVRQECSTVILRVLQEGETDRDDWVRKLSRLLKPYAATGQIDLREIDTETVYRAIKYLDERRQQNDLPFRLKPSLSHTWVYDATDDNLVLPRNDAYSHHSETTQNLSFTSQPVAASDADEGSKNNISGSGRRPDDGTLELQSIDGTFRIRGKNLSGVSPDPDDLSNINYHGIPISPCFADFLVSLPSEETDSINFRAAGDLNAGINTIEEQGLLMIARELHKAASMDEKQNQPRTTNKL